MHISNFTHYYLLTFIFIFVYQNTNIKSYERRYQLSIAAVQAHQALRC